MDKTVLVWITNPAACDNIVRTGKRIADEAGAELMVASIQHTIRGDWDSTVNDLECLSNASHSVNAELTVIYSDNILESAVKTLDDVKPVAIVTGIPGNRDRSLFIDQMQVFDNGIPIYTVDGHGNAIKLS